jgi:hypothetical protein
MLEIRTEAPVQIMGLKHFVDNLRTFVVFCSFLRQVRATTLRKRNSVLVLLCNRLQHNLSQ